MYVIGNFIKINIIEFNVNKIILISIFLFIFDKFILVVGENNINYW